LQIPSERKTRAHLTEKLSPIKKIDILPDMSSSLISLDQYTNHQKDLSKNSFTETKGKKLDLSLQHSKQLHPKTDRKKPREEKSNSILCKMTEE
jgi:hypothetical protein